MNTVIIRGQVIDIDFWKEDIEQIRSSSWVFSKWNAENTKISYCIFCSLGLFDSDYAFEKYGYTNGKGRWICHECYRKTITKDYIELEFVLKHKLILKNSGVYLFVSPMVLGADFEITANSYFGNHKLQYYLDIPRKILKSGEQDYNTYALLLKFSDEFDELIEDNLYVLSQQKKPLT